MTAGDLGRWEPLAVAEVAGLFGAAPFRWWISGGRALECHLGRTWRDHDDTDVGLTREEVPRLRSVLVGDVHVAAAGRHRPWTGEAPRAEHQENNLWCRTDQHHPWALDLTIGDGDATVWRYRRDPSVTFPWSTAVLHTEDRVPYLAPELQLLFKSKGTREKDDLDAREVIPELDPSRLDRLSGLLPIDHPWQTLIGAL